MSAKIKLISEADGRKVYAFHCPGCKFDHHPETPKWTFNGDLGKPTFRNSILVCGNDAAARCHSFVTDGRIQFLADCFHDLKGQTVELPDWAEDAPESEREKEIERVVSEAVPSPKGKQVWRGNHWASVAEE